jgi:uridine nucleosidase
VFGISEGPPLHDPLAVAAVLSGTEWEIPFYDWNVKAEGKGQPERFGVVVTTKGTFEEACNGEETGRTGVTLLKAGTPGVRIPRGVDISRFWRTIEACIERADLANSAGS